jgi:hypothetical protein
MQHLDEGMIHTWLDGELPTQEAAAVEAHVAECAQCAAAAAEARGFIAGSSRILTALDDAPRGVIPIRPVVRRRLGPAWRAAAAVLIVALGTVAIRNTLRVDRSTANETTSSDSVPSTSATESAATTSVGSTAGTAAADQSVRPMVLTQPAAPSKEAATRPMAAAAVRGPAPQGMIAQAQKSDVPAARTMNKSAELPAARPPASVPMSEAAQDARAEPPLKIVRVDSTSVERRTVFEVAANETVTLVERVVGPAGELGKVPATGTTTGAAALSAPVTPDSRRVMSAPVARSTVAGAPSQVTTGFANAEQAIEWKDAATGTVLRLTGRFPPERLQEIRKRIERQRAAQKKP